MGNNASDNNKSNGNNNNYPKASMERYKQTVETQKDDKVLMLMRKCPNMTRQEAKDVLEGFDYDVDKAYNYCVWQQQENLKKKREEEEKKRLQIQQQEASKKRQLQLQQQQQQQRQQAQRMQVSRMSQPDEDEDKKADIEDVINFLASAIMIEKSGFCLATDENCKKAVALLEKVPCQYRTVLRDGIAAGIIHLLRLKAVLMELKTFAQYKFIHVVLTDGEDTGSKITTKDLKELFGLLNQEIGDACKTFFIGVGLDVTGTKELKEIVSMGGEAAEFYRCDDVGIADIFGRIQLALVRRQEIAVIGNEDMAIIAARQNYGLQVSVNNYLVLFTLDISGSMAGGRWRKVVQSVSKFLESMPSRDIFGILTFNENIKILTGNAEE